MNGNVGTQVFLESKSGTLSPIERGVNNGQMEVFSARHRRWFQTPRADGWGASNSKLAAW